MLKQARPAVVRCQGERWTQQGASLAGCPLMYLTVLLDEPSWPYQKPDCPAYWSWAEVEHQSFAAGWVWIRSYQVLRTLMPNLVVPGFPLVRAKR